MTDNRYPSRLCLLECRAKGERPFKVRHFKDRRPGSIAPAIWRRRRPRQLPRMTQAEKDQVLVNLSPVGKQMTRAYVGRDPKKKPPQRRLIGRRGSRHMKVRLLKKSGRPGARRRSGGRLEGGGSVR